MAARSGFFVLADISGFTAFMAATELEHGAEITRLLLEAVIRRLAPPLEIQEVEGDAVFAVGEDGRLADPAVLPRVVAAAGAAFRQERERMMALAPCPCSACSALPGLDLKVIVHHGRFVRQSVGGRSRLAGPDVILAHRLLKLPGDARGQLVLTAAALARLGLAAGDGGLQGGVASYSHLGAVPYFAAPLAGAPLAAARPAA
jgi:class 3 adenylate cyclase